MGLFILAKSTVVYAAYLLLPYIVFCFGYRLWLHPLSRYPGPFFAKILDGYGGLYALTRKGHLITYANHIKYGPVVRMGPNRLVFNTVDALHDIYQNPKVLKSPLYNAAQLSPQHNVFDETDIDAHRRKRKVISQPLSERSMRTFAPTLSGQVDTFIRQLRASSGRSDPVNMTERSVWLAGDVVGELSFGYALETQTDGANRWLLPGMAMSSARINMYMQMPSLRKLEPLLRFIVRKKREQFLGVIGEMVRSRVALDKDAKHDLYAFAADELQVGENLGQSELWAEALLFIIAGGNTIASALSAVFFYLSRYSRCYQRLADEIRSSYASADEIQPDAQLRACEYLQACINEALRLAPPNTASLWRRQAADDNEPLVVDGHVIPRGTDVAVNLYAIHHNEEYFPQPFVFRPERWLESETPDDQLQAMRRAFAPFSIGSRSCPGKALAVTEVSLAVARALWSFDFEVAPGALSNLGAGDPARTDGRHRKDEYQLYDVFSSMHDGPMLQFHVRS